MVAPAAASFLAIAQAIDSSLATPKITALLPDKFIMWAHVGTVFGLEQGSLRHLVPSYQTNLQAEMA